MDQAIALGMFASAADVLGTLVDRTVSAGEATAGTSEASLRVEPDSVTTRTEIPAAGITFAASYGKATLGKIVELMLGTPAGDGEMDAMQLSIVTETVAQISSAMGESLSQSLGVASQNIRSEVPTEAAAFAAPPFTTFSAQLDVAGEFAIGLTLAFDGLALAKIAPAPAPPAPAAEPVAAAPARPAPAPARPAAPPPPSAPVSFAPMTPTPIRAAAPGEANLELVHDVPLEISAVLGQTALSLRDVVALQNGSVLELDKLSTDPIDLYVNKILIARGEVVVVDEKFAVKISELNPEADRV